MFLLHPFVVDTITADVQTRRPIPFLQIHKTGITFYHIKLYLHSHSINPFSLQVFAAQQTVCSLFHSNNDKTPHKNILDQPIFHFPRAPRFSFVTDAVFRRTTVSTTLTSSRLVLPVVVDVWQQSLRRRSQSVLRCLMRHDHCQSQRPRQYANPTTFFNCVCLSQHVKAIRKTVQRRISSLLYQVSSTPSDFSYWPSGSLSRHTHTTPRVLDHPQRLSQFFRRGFTCGYSATWPAVVRTFISPARHIRNTDNNN
jgi:hypothetical protein